MQRSHPIRYPIYDKLQSVPEKDSLDSPDDDNLLDCRLRDGKTLFGRHDQLSSKAKLRAVYICTDGADCCTVMCFLLLYCRCHLRCIRMMKYFRTKIEIIIIIKPVRADINILWAKTTVYTRRMIGSTHEYLLITSLLFRLVIVVKS